MRLMRNSRPCESLGILSSGSSSSETSLYREIPVDLMVMPRSASSARVSVKRWSPAEAMEMIPAAATSESVRVDLPAQHTMPSPAASLVSPTLAH